MGGAENVIGKLNFLQQEKVQQYSRSPGSDSLPVKRSSLPLSMEDIAMEARLLINL